MIDQIFSQVSVSGVPMHLGSEYESENDAPPVIVWTPEGGDFHPGKRIANFKSGTPREISWCGVRVKVRLWAVWPQGTPLPTGYDQSMADWQMLWDLIRRFLVAIRSVAPVSYALGELKFLSDEGGPLEEYGKAADLWVTWEVPVTTDALSEVQVTDPSKLQMEGTIALSSDITEAPSP